MRVVVCTIRSAGPSHDRVADLAGAVADAQLGVEVVLARGLTTTMSRGADPVVVDVDDQGADVVVVQRPGTAEMLQCARILQSRGIAVVADVDDGVSAPAHGRPAHLLAEFAVSADLVTVTGGLGAGRYASGPGRQVEVPHAVPRRFAELVPAFERDAPVTEIGWVGDVAAGADDLQVMGSGLQQSLDATAGRSRFTVLGTAGEARRLLGLSADPRGIAASTDRDARLAAVGQLLDIGVVPCRPGRSTGGQQVLEYAARGVYVVQSTTAPGGRVGLGWQARAATDWARGITRAVDHPSWRREQARLAHRTVLEQHLTEHTVPLWLDAWQRAAENRATALRRGAVAVG